MEWSQARERLAAPMYAPLAPAIARLDPARWPTLADLTALAAGVETATARALRFVPPRGPGDPERRHYEARIAEAGEVETRPDNWHDLFNALAWITWPRAKAGLNAQHVAILGERGAAEARHRSPERDALTLFDEGGVVVAASDPTLLGHIVDFEWKALFWTRREEALAHARFFVFGHACCEQLLAPYLGMVAKTVLVPVAADFLALPAPGQVAALDLLLAGHFSARERFSSPKALPPMPVLGVPGWHFAPQDEAFYDDPDHFRTRPGKRR